MKHYGRTLIRLLVLVLLLLQASAAPALAWDREQARDYAQSYAINHNPRFKYLSGSDCTNFVSQCLYSGGIAMDADWYYNFAYDTMGYYWAYAPGLHNYFKDSPRTHTYRYLVGTYDWDPDSSRPQPPKVVSQMLRGDIISYDEDLDGGGDWTIDHVAIITGKNATSTLNSSWKGDLTCQHSTDYRRVAWQCRDRHSIQYIESWGYAAWGLLDSLH